MNVDFLFGIQPDSEICDVLFLCSGMAIDVNVLFYWCVLFTEVYYVGLVRVDM